MKNFHGTVVNVQCNCIQIVQLLQKKTAYRQGAADWAPKVQPSARWRRSVVGQIIAFDIADEKIQKSVGRQGKGMVIIKQITQIERRSIFDNDSMNIFHVGIVKG